jgi:hypothetical protein
MSSSIPNHFLNLWQNNAPNQKQKVRARAHTHTHTPKYAVAISSIDTFHMLITLHYAQCTSVETSAVSLYCFPVGALSLP